MEHFEQLVVIFVSSEILLKSDIEDKMQTLKKLFCD